MDLRAALKQTELGVIPVDWEVKQIGDLKPFVTSGSRAWATFYSEHGSPFIRITNLSRDCIYLDLQDLRFVNIAKNETEATRTALQDGDVLISITADIGIIGYVSPKLPKPAYINQHIALVRFDPGRTSSKFVSYFLATGQPQSLFRMLTDSGAKAGMNLTTVQHVLLALPPTIAEQHAIAETLSDVDALIESLERLIAKKCDVKQGAMHDLLAGKKRLAGFSGEWEVKPLGDLFSFSGGLSASRDQLSTEGFCYLHYGDIHMSKKTSVDVRSEFQDIPKLDIPLNQVPTVSLLNDGDVVFVDASEDDEGTSKHVVIVNPTRVPFISGLHTIVAKSRTDGLDHQYRRHCFQTSAVKSQFSFFAVGTKVSGISKTNIAKITLPVPPVPEQTAIAAILSEMDAEIAVLETRIAKARALKQGMMRELLTGRIRLGSAPSHIAPFSVQRNTGAAANRPHNLHINEAVVIAVLAKRFGSTRFPLGRFRRTKLSYLLHRRVERMVDGYLKKAAGPYNPRIRYGGAEKIAIKNGYVLEHRNGKYDGFLAGRNIAEAERYFEKWYGSDVLRWLEQFRHKKNNELEVLTTIDLAREDLRREGKVVTFDNVKEVIRKHPEWEAKLDRDVFSDRSINLAIRSCENLFAADGDDH